MSSRVEPEQPLTFEKQFEADRLGIKLALQRIRKDAERRKVRYIDYAVVAKRDGEVTALIISANGSMTLSAPGADEYYPHPEADDILGAYASTIDPAVQVLDPAQRNQFVKANRERFETGLRSAMNDVKEQLTSGW